MDKISALAAASNLNALLALPGVHVEGDLALSYLPALTALPTGLTVGGDLVLYDLPALTALPADLALGGCVRGAPCERVLAGDGCYTLRVNSLGHITAGCRAFRTIAHALAHWEGRSDHRAVLFTRALREWALKTPA